jgi:hypothetical protein
MPENVRASTSRNPKGLHGLYMDTFTFTLSNDLYWQLVELLGRIISTVAMLLRTQYTHIDETWTDIQQKMLNLD